jgi:protein-S-isoprenylcysteine O-methyltransferase Ste14
MTKILIQGIAVLVIGVAVLELLLFLLAGTFDYWQAWVAIPVFMLSMSVYGIYFSIKDPEVMERRKQVASPDQSTLQKIVGAIAFTGLAAVFVVPGLDHRFGWSQVPPLVSWIGNALDVLSFVVYYFVLKQNRYGGASIQTYKGQQVTTTGPYALVRHPLYVGALIMVIGIVLALGSWWALALIAVMIPVLVIRILDEENMLKRDLPGYVEYEQKVRYRLLPYLW